MNRAIFLDRDGTLNRDHGYTYKIEDLVILPGVIEGLKKIMKLGKFKLFIITNQSGIDRGHYTKEDFWKFMDFLTSELSEHGIHIDDIYFSPDIPEKATFFRKPGIGMLKQAEKKHNIDLSRSYVIGDRSIDVEMGYSVGCKTILIKNERLKKYPPMVKPDTLVKDMVEAAEWIKKQEKKLEEEKAGKKEFNKKFYKIDELKKIIKKLKKQNPNIEIVSVNGSFDILHYGHIYFLNEAKKQGDVLVVMLNSDKSIKKYKSKDRPINKEKHRIGVLSVLEMVDYITLFDETTPIKTLDMIKPDVHANGAEYGKGCIEAKTVKKNGGKLYLVKRVGDFSTTEMIRKIKKG